MSKVRLEHADRAQGQLREIGRTGLLREAGRARLGMRGRTWGFGRGDPAVNARRHFFGTLCNKIEMLLTPVR